MNSSIFEQMHSEGLLSEASLQKLKENKRSALFSLHWELKTLLYLGVLLLSAGLGILIYQNIDTIGHQVILLFIALLCIACFYYCNKNKLPFSKEKVEAPNSFFDYILLLGCLTFLSFLTYLQVQYTVFGEALGLATFLPMVFLFFCAYYFDHLGVLAMAITNLAAWMGIAVTPMTILKGNQFADAEIIFAGLVLGALLTFAGRLSHTKHFKPHFSFSYCNFGMNIFFIATLAGMFQFEDFYLLWLLPLAAGCYYFFGHALRENSFYFLLMTTLYGYIGCSYVFIRLIASASDSVGIIYLILFYFLISALAVVGFLIRMNKKMKHHAGL